MEALANGSWLTRERITRIAAMFGVASTLAIAALVLTARGPLDYMGRPLGTDFSNIWIAGGFALNGHAAEAWDFAKFSAAQQAMYGPKLSGVYIWAYPPPFLFIAAPLARLPYLVALLVWQLATLIPLAWMIQRLAKKREAVLLTLAAPVTLICLVHGHNGFLTALLLGGGLILLDRRPFVAGLLFGCLIYKPQLGLVIPPLLLAGRNWRAIAGACASAALLVGFTLAFWGWPVWQAFFAALPLTQHLVLEEGAAGWFKLMSPFAAVRMWGGTMNAAYALQGVITLVSIAAVAWIAATKRMPQLRNALVCAAAVASTPYVFDYDFVVLLPAIAFLAIDGERNGWLPWEKTLLAAVWVFPLAARSVAEVSGFPLGLTIALTIEAIALRRFVVRASPFRRLREASAQ